MMALWVPGDSTIVFAEGKKVSVGRQEDFVCTQVIGYSQVNQWYKGFESMLDNDRWELLWHTGAGVDRWSDPNFKGWTDKIVSPAKQQSRDPDRVVLSISGDYGDDVGMWARKILETVDVIHSKYKNVRLIVLQPVIGGHNHEACPAPAGESGKKVGGGSQGTGGNEIVRAAYQHPYIDQAIAKVVAGDKTGRLVTGASPEVRSCKDYSDAKGHLTSSASDPIGRSIAEFYILGGAENP